MRNIRQETIIRLIRTKHIRNQEELKKFLAREGFPVTQATISRDVRELHLMKKAGEDGIYYYQEQPTAQKIPDFMNGNIKKIDYAENMLVVKCVSGTAQAVCTMLDKMERPEIVGTLAGDDTIFVLMRSARQAVQFARELMENLQNR